MLLSAIHGLDIHIRFACLHAWSSGPGPVVQWTEQVHMILFVTLQATPERL